MDNMRLSKRFLSQVLGAHPCCSALCVLMWITAAHCSQPATLHTTSRFQEAVALLPAEHGSGFGAAQHAACRSVARAGVRFWLPLRRHAD